jgi:hypothetical protein
MLNWLVDERGIEPHIPVWDKSQRTDGTFWDCQEFRARLGMMGSKEPRNAATQGAYYS